MDPLHLSIALGPLAVYLFLMGVINVSGRPFMTTGGRDTASLGIAISGFVIAGPMELFLPDEAAIVFGGYVWLLCLLFYTLCLVLLVLLMRPRLVIYNTSAEQLRPILEKVATELDPHVRQAGDTMVLPGLGVQLNLEPIGAMRSAQLVAAGPRQNYAGWRRLESALALGLKQARSAPNPHGVMLALVGAAMIVIIAFSVLREPQTVAQAFWDMLRLPPSVD